MPQVVLRNSRALGAPCALARRDVLGAPGLESRLHLGGPAADAPLHLVRVRVRHAGLDRSEPLLQRAVGARRLDGALRVDARAAAADVRVGAPVVGRVARHPVGLHARRRLRETLRRVLDLLEPARRLGLDRLEPPLVELLRASNALGLAVPVFDGRIIMVSDGCCTALLLRCCCALQFNAAAGAAAECAARLEAADLQYLRNSATVKMPDRRH